jgi:hypothetical protein
LRTGATQNLSFALPPVLSFNVACIMAMAYSTSHTCTHRLYHGVTLHGSRVNYHSIVLQILDDRYCQNSSQERALVSETCYSRHAKTGGSWTLTSGPCRLIARCSLPCNRPSRLHVLECHQPRLKRTSIPHGWNLFGQPCGLGTFR